MQFSIVFLIDSLLGTDSRAGTRKPEIVLFLFFLPLVSQLASPIHSSAADLPQTND
jgi:hypothetical protein